MPALVINESDLGYAAAGQFSKGENYRQVAATRLRVNSVWRELQTGRCYAAAGRVVNIAREIHAARDWP